MSHASHATPDHQFCVMQCWLHGSPSSCAPGMVREVSATFVATTMSLEASGTAANTAAWAARGSMAYSGSTCTFSGPFAPSAPLDPSVFGPCNHPLPLNPILLTRCHTGIRHGRQVGKTAPVLGIFIGLLLQALQALLVTCVLCTLNVAFWRILCPCTPAEC